PRHRACHRRRAPWLPADGVPVPTNAFGPQPFDRRPSPAVRPAPRNPYSRSPSRVRRFDARLPATVAQDTYFVVEAGAVWTRHPPPAAPPARLGWTSPPRCRRPPPARSTRAGATLRGLPPL